MITLAKNNLIGKCVLFAKDSGLFYITIIGVMQRLDRETLVQALWTKENRIKDLKLGKYDLFSLRGVDTYPAIYIQSVVVLGTENGRFDFSFILQPFEPSQIYLKKKIEQQQKKYDTIMAEKASEARIRRKKRKLVLD